MQNDGTVIKILALIIFSYIYYWETRIFVLELSMWRDGVWIKIQTNSNKNTDYVWSVIF